VLPNQATAEALREAALAAGVVAPGLRLELVSPLDHGARVERLPPSPRASVATPEHAGA
jgi:hypothetical protein